MIIDNITPENTKKGNFAVHPSGLILFFSERLGYDTHFFHQESGIHGAGHTVGELVVENKFITMQLHFETLVLD